MMGGSIARITDNKIFRQYAKFCIIGGVCFVVDASIHYVLMFVARVGDASLADVVGRSLHNALHVSVEPSTLAFACFKGVTTLLGILVGYVLNSLWTFRVGLKEGGSQSLLRYTLIALCGFALNLLISSFLYNVIPGHPKQSWAIALVVSTALVSVVNFTLQRMWTFERAPRTVSRL